MLDQIQIRGARQHNLQDIDVEIPRNQLTVMTGLSGSGKSSLAFDTIYAEGHRRYVETLSPYARQFLDQMQRPDLDSIDGLSPALSIEQKTTGRSPRSTVGTVTEIYDYLRLLFSSVGTPYCITCDRPITRQPSDQMAARIFEERLGSRVDVLAPFVRGRKGHYRKELADFARKGFALARIDGQLERLDDYPFTVQLDRNKTHTIEVVVDRVTLRKGAEKRLENAIRTASKLANGLVLVLDEKGSESLHSEKLACVECGASLPEFEPRSFSFNSKYGACPRCGGLGEIWELDPAKLVRNPARSVLQCGWPSPRSRGSPLREAEYWAPMVGIDLKQPWNKLNAEEREWMLYGHHGKLPPGHPLKDCPFGGLINGFRRQLGIRAGFHPTAGAEAYMSQMPCRDCAGRRLKPESLAVRLAGTSIATMAQMPISGLRRSLDELPLEGRKRIVAERVLDEIRERVAFLEAVGLGYLSLDRPTGTLSGGEAQRVRLATQIGTRLRGVLYVLDEPSIGLHSRDHGRLLDTLAGLRDLGNTVVVVEHDQATIERADYVVDLGPGAGRLGGNLVVAGPPEAVANAEGSLTGDYLAGRKTAYGEAVPDRSQSRQLVVRGARQHNLQNIDVEFPLGNLCVVTGVSGSGKSTLVNGILYPVLASLAAKSELPAGEHDRVEGIEHIDKVVRIDQTPVGRTPRSNPATYTGVFTPIRDFYAMLPEARARGYKPGRFSFNVADGRCDACKGDGIKRIEMNFLPDVFVTCETCHGKRYKQETLQVLYKGYSIADLLEATVEHVLEVTEALPLVRRKLQTLVDVGLGYIQLGQAATTISGGEAQRMKLARELSKRQTGKTVYILDEPTTGLHFDDVRKLLKVLQRLVEHGNTVIVIEHQLDVIRSADWVVDLGPEGGEEGGLVVCAGPPAEVAAVERSHTGRALREAGVG